MAAKVDLAQAEGPGDEGGREEAVRQGRRAVSADRGHRSERSRLAPARGRGLPQGARCAATPSPSSARAAEGYAKGGFLLKAIAVCKVVLQLDAQAHDDAGDARRAATPSAKGGPTPSAVLAAPSRPVAAPPASVVPPASVAPRVSVAPPASVAPPVAAPAVVDSGPPPIDEPTRRATAGANLQGRALGAVRRRRHRRGCRGRGRAGGVRDRARRRAPRRGHRHRRRRRARFLRRHARTPRPPRRRRHRRCRKIPLLSSLDADDLRHVIERVEVRDYEPRDVIMRQGDRRRLALRHRARPRAVVIEEPARELASLGEGAFFGELALLTNFPRSATVVAVEPTQLLEISRELVSRDRAPLARRAQDAVALLPRSPARSAARHLAGCSRRSRPTRRGRCRSLLVPRARAAHARHRARASARRACSCSCAATRASGAAAPRWRAWPRATSSARCRF